MPRHEDPAESGPVPAFLDRLARRVQGAVSMLDVECIGRCVLDSRRSSASCILSALLLLALCLLVMPAPASPTTGTTPEDILKSYVRAIYARNYPSAYQLISAIDRKLKSEPQYVQEYIAFSGHALELSSALAALIRFEDLDTTIAGNRAKVTFNVVAPDANAPMTRSLLLDFDAQRLQGLSADERAQRAEQLRVMAANGQLPVLVGEDERWELIREEGRWRLFLNWAGAVEVNFEAVTRAGLQWEFVPLQPMVRAVPGETLQTSYRVKNLADREITGKARHILKPPADSYLDIVICFCFLQQTLNPGEEMLLPVVFRVDYDVPDDVQQMQVRYEFYPADKFPRGNNK